MVANYEEPMEIILLTYHEMKSTVMGFHVYQDKWEPVIGETLNTHMEPQNEVDKYAVAVLDKEKNVIGHLPKWTSGKYAKTIFYFLGNDSVNFARLKLQDRLLIWATIKA